MVGVTGGGEGKLSGEWKLIRASAFWGLLARMASALKIKSPTLVKEFLHRAEQLDCLQSVFDFCLFAAVVVYFAQSWSPTQ